MARIRNVKPELFRHKGLQELERDYPDCRPMLVFVGLWTQCDKNGVFAWDADYLHLDLLPFTEIDLESTIQLLRGAGFVYRFTAEGKAYGFIPTFKEHQKISGTERKYPAKYPVPPEDILSTPQGDDMEATRKRRGSYMEATETEGGHKDIGHRTQDIGQIPSVRASKDGSYMEATRESQEEPSAPSSQSSLVPVETKKVPAKKGDLPPPLLAVFHAAREAFEQNPRAKGIMYQDRATTAREMKALKTLVERASNLCPDAPSAFLAQAMDRYKVMVNGKLQGKASWTPSGLATDWIWRLVLEGMEAAPSPEDQATVQAFAGILTKKAGQ